VPPVDVALTGFLTGLSLIVAIGAQNAYVLRLGLARNHVALAVSICASADVALIVAGIAGIGAVVRAHPDALTVVRWIGVVYLVGYAIHSFWRASRSEVLLPADEPLRSRSVVAGAMLAFTFLNPHVYLDTVLLLGSIGNQYGDDRWWFAAGASLASIAWFSTLGFGATAASRLMARPVTWRLLDALIGIVMLVVAAKLVLTDLG
jgi:L-lysine exporter family protein LysE/ArgO